MRSSSFILACLVILLGCATSNETTDTDTESSNQYDNQNVVQVEESTITLADYLQRVPGVFIQGTGNNISVIIRGASSVNSGNEPLFVIDGHPVGNNYSTASRSVDMNDIDRIEVLKSSEGSIRYGLRGSNGVVVIKTKKGKRKN